MKATLTRLFTNSDEASTLLATRRRLLVLTSGLTFVIAFVWIAMTAGTVITRPALAVFCGLAPLFFLAFPILALRSQVSLEFLAHAFLLVLFAVIAFVAASLGGPVSTTSYYLVLVPMLATLLLGGRAGVAWLCVVVLTYFAMDAGRAWLPTPTYDIINDRISAPEVSVWNAIALTLVACAATFAVTIFQDAARRSSQLLVRAALDARKSEEALHAAEEVSRSRSEFLANMSHELRTPLNAIIGYGELLQESAEAESRDADATDSRQLLDAAARLKAMVDGVIQLSADAATRIEAVDCDVDSGIRDGVFSMQGPASANGNVLEAAAQRVGAWRCDDQKLDQCLRHLVSNAAKFTRNGRITIRAEECDVGGRSWLRFEVSDTGIGIDAAHLGLLFKPFGVIDSSFTRAQQGAGLGLAICRRLTEAMGGDASVESKPGEGSTFALSFPAERVLAEATSRLRSDAA
jgi:signal transduction histidine kinase